MNVHFSSATDLWATPQDFFDKQNAIYGFTLDVCATADNAKCARYFTEADNGLEQPWVGVCWMNPPYGTHNRPMDEESLREQPNRRDRRLPCPIAHRYTLVARLCHEGPG